MTTVEDFLRPPLGPLELGYVVLVKVSEYVQRKYDSANISGNAQKRHDGSDNSRYPPLAELQEFWLEFDVENIASQPSIAACLNRPCVVRWEPQIPRFARVVYIERQLEVLFLQTLITRVNIALDKAIPPNEERIAILVNPGAFESVSAEASAERLLPDWIVVQGDFDIGMEADLLPVIMDLARQRRILAVGDTKLVRKGGSSGNVSYTKACHYKDMCQLQDYCLNVYTRFGFILSNEELVVLQILPAQEASPRKAEQRGLRSNGGHQLEPGLDSQGTDSLNSMHQDGYDDDASMSEHNGRDDDEDPYEYGLPPLLSPSRKRPHPSTSPESSPVAAASRRFRNASLSGSDTSSRQINSHRISSYQIPSDPPGSDPPGSDPFGMEASQTSSSQDHSRYAPSVRDIEAGAIQIRSFDMRDWGAEGKESPYRVLFMFVMMIRALKLQQQPIHISRQE